MDKKTIKKTFKFICDSCGEFFELKREYCEKCGNSTLRKATKNDHANYLEIKGIVIEKRLKIGSKIMIGLATVGLIFVIFGITLSVLALREPLNTQTIPVSLTLAITGALLLAVAIGYIFRDSPDCCLCYLR